jgi:hypothetical protein
MGERWRRWKSIGRKVMQVILLVALLRLLMGVVIIVFFDRQAVAWWYELGLISLGVLAVFAVVAFSTWRWSPARERGR